MSEVVAAVRNNVEWCDLVCRAHDVPTSREGGVWVARGTPPVFHPDLVSESKSIPASAVAALLQDRAACAVKDSWATLELSGMGFAVLFTAEWIFCDRAQGGNTGLDWTSVTEPEELYQWETAAGLEGLVTAGLLAEPSVRVIVARRKGRIAGGAIANVSDSVVGVSNVFTVLADGLSVVWKDLPVVLHRLFPGRPLVGYERGDDLEAARSAGCRGVGPLRVWVRR
jgi:hypothetical protein